MPDLFGFTLFAIFSATSLLMLLCNKESRSAKVKRGLEMRRRIMRFKDGVLYNNVRFTDRDIDLVWNADGSRPNTINLFSLT